MIKDLKKTTMKLRKDRDPLGPTMQFHLSEISNIGKAKQRETTDDEAVQYVKKAVATMKKQEGSDEREIATLESLLPKMASDEEVKEFLSTLDTSNIGLTMKAVKDKFGPLVDMKKVKDML